MFSMFMLNHRSPNIRSWTLFIMKNIMQRNMFIFNNSFEVEIIKVVKNEIQIKVFKYTIII